MPVVAVGTLLVINCMDEDIAALMSVFILF
jgi:hypothetical protein